MCHYYLSGSLDKLLIWRKSLPGCHRIPQFPKREERGRAERREEKGERERENGLRMSPKRRLEYLP